MVLNSLADYCRSLPHVTEDIKWGSNLVFMIGGKMFCVFSIEQGVLRRVSFKVEDHRFLEMTDRPQFIPAPYMARARWVSTVDGALIDGKEFEALVILSYQHYFSKLTRKLQRELS